MRGWQADALWRTDEDPAEIADGIDPAAGQMATFPVAPLMHGAAQLATFITQTWAKRWSGP